MNEEIKWQVKKQFDRQNRSRKAAKASQRKVQQKRGNKHNFVQGVATRLQTYTPKSEVWFKAFLVDAKLDSLFLENVPLNSMIPDFINLDKRIVIEIDGNVHQRPEQIQRDARKTKEYNRLGYTLFRINHLDNEQALQAIQSIQELIK